MAIEIETGLSGLSAAIAVRPRSVQRPETASTRDAETLDQAAEAEASRRERASEATQQNEQAARAQTRFFEDSQESTETDHEFPPATNEIFG